MEKPVFFINKPDNILPSGSTDEIFRKSDPLSFHQTLEDYKPTPLVELNSLANKFGVKKIYVKDESFRFGLNAFKGLGASYAMHKLLEQDPSIETFCTATDGNHGRAVAWAAKKFGKNSRIFVPRGTTEARIDAIQGEGAIVEVMDRNYEATCDYAQIMAQGNGWTLVQDTTMENYDEIPAHIMAGYLTHFIEEEGTLNLLPEAQIDVIFLQSGVGSWPAAAAWYYTNRYGNKKPKLAIVEPAEAAGLLASLNAGRRTSPTGNFTTMMAGLNCGIPSASAWEILKNTIDAVVAIEDTYAVEAIREFYFSQEGDPRIMAGESGAGGLAGFIAVMQDERFEEVKKHLGINENSRMLLFNTEGATDPPNFQKIIDDIYR
ncbi:MAG: diaminopropionate ammonia-lyase [Gillisia sp.]